MQGLRDSILSARLFHALTIALLLVALVFGGASRDEVISSDIVGLIALPVLALGVWRLRDGIEPAHRLPLLIMAGVVVLPLLQLIPLPAGLWTALPGRAPVVDGLRAAGLEPGWAPVSLSPQHTWSSWLSLIPAVAMFVAALSLDMTARMRLSLILLAFAGLSVLLGAAQLAGGEDSPLRFYAITNKSAAVGFFSNRNHLASFMICAVVLAACHATLAAMRRPAPRLTLGLSLAMIGLATIGAGLTGSRAGLLLLIPAGLGAIALAWRAGVGQGRGRAILGLLGGGFVGGVIIVRLSFGAAIDRLQANFSGDIRLVAAEISWKAIKAFAPLGSGFGAFVPVYKMHEPTEAVDNTYMNHAHNDWLEVSLEGGLPAVLLLIVFLLWFGRTALDLWRKGGVEQTFARAASLCVLLLLTHSALDYPLRTPVLMILFAFACGSMLPWLGIQAARRPQNPVSTPTRERA